MSHKLAALQVPLPQHVSGSNKSDKCKSDSGCRCLKPQVCQVTNPGHGRTNISHNACQDCHAGGAGLMTLGPQSRLRVICMQKGQAPSCPLLPSSVQPPAPASNMGHQTFCCSHRISTVQRLLMKATVGRCHLLPKAPCIWHPPPAICSQTACRMSTKPNAVPDRRFTCMQQAKGGQGF